MKHVSHSEEHSWNNKKLENGPREKMILREFRMKDLIYSKVLLSKEKRTPKKSMPNELKISESEKLKTKKRHLQKFKEGELRF